MIQHVCICGDGPNGCNPKPFDDTCRYEKALHEVLALPLSWGDHIEVVTRVRAVRDSGLREDK